MNKYLAEFIGTFTLTSVVLLSLTGVFPVSTPVLAGLVLGIFVYTIGHISGTHLNPAVTVGLWSIGKIRLEAAASYIAAQMLAGLSAMLLMTMALGRVSTLSSNFSLTVLMAEILGMALFTFGIAAVVYGRAEDDFSGVVVGASLFLGIAVAAMLGSNGVLNPAVALGIGSFGLAYILGPVLGSVIGFNLYKFVSREK
jgi:aquaporin Z